MIFFHTLVQAEAVILLHNILTICAIPVSLTANSSSDTALTLPSLGLRVESLLLRQADPDLPLYAAAISLM